MDINNITIALRPRSDWEAFDLGFIMTRRWWTKLLLAWLLVAAPLFVVCVFAFTGDSVWTLLLFWWLKPLYEQLPLYFISRAVFNHIPERQEIIGALPGWVLKRLIPMVTWRRLSLNRSFTSPVTQLEGLTGQARTNRIRILSGRRNAGFWLTLTCFLLEWAVTLALIVFCIILVPSDYLGPFMDLVEKGPVEGYTLISLFYFCGAAIMAPFYVVSGFSLYLNRRTRLEGWDLELAFEKLAARLQGSHAGRSVAAALAILGVFTLAAGLIPAPATAAAPEQPAVLEKLKETLKQGRLDRRLSAEQGKALIDDVLNAAEFNETKTVSRWRLKEQYRNDKDDSDNLDWWQEVMRALAELFSPVRDFFAGLGYYSLWLLAAVAIIAGAWLLPRLRPYLTGVGLSRRDLGRPLPDTVFGMAISRESLPEDIAGEALTLFRNGHSRQALSLLYRGSLHVLISAHGLELRDSDTEGQCARRVRDDDIPVADYFSRLTGTWVRLAYGHQAPEAPMVETLCNDWNENFHRSYHGG